MYMQTSHTCKIILVGVIKEKFSSFLERNIVECAFLNERTSDEFHNFLWKPGDSIWPRQYQWCQAVRPPPAQVSRMYYTGFVMWFVSVMPSSAPTSCTSKSDVLHGFCNVGYVDSLKSALTLKFSTSQQFPYGNGIFRM